MQLLVEVLLHLLGAKGIEWSGIKQKCIGRADLPSTTMTCHEKLLSDCLEVVVWPIDYPEGSIVFFKIHPDFLPIHPGSSGRAGT